MILTDADRWKSKQLRWPLNRHVMDASALAGLHALQKNLRKPCVK